ncbi:MAG: hypothetical protein J0I20_01055 [Chloroflexi bacterium]|nr:hypothetical protein [Chloroflexota bacterium]OJV89620.1 MAG: hypothetical protein BGO39_37325 [Chloroflexi bacterium 54-19]
MRHYCTYFDKNFLAKGLTLYASLEKFARPFTLWVLCFDDITYNELSALGNSDLIPVRMAELEKFDPALLVAKENRSLVEYYFTCSPAWPLYLLKTHPEIDIITYLDSDLWFFANPEPLFNELGEKSILIIEHRFPKTQSQLEEYGKYNVGILSFRNDKDGRVCLEWWRERCLEWCYDRLEDGKYADQKYLNDWPTRFKQVVVLQHKGVNLAPWNWMNYTIIQDGNSFLVDNEPLICYHFHRLKQLNRWIFDPQEDLYKPMPVKTRRKLYLPYIRQLNRQMKKVQSMSGLKVSSLSLRFKNYGLVHFAKRLIKGRLIISL